MSDAVTLDTRGMKCPLPVLKARKAMKELPPGGTLYVLATDPGSVKDFEHFCRVTGATMLDCRHAAGGVIEFMIRKPG